MASRTTRLSRWPKVFPSRKTPVWCKRGTIPDVTPPVCLTVRQADRQAGRQAGFALLGPAWVVLALVLVGIIVFAGVIAYPVGWSQLNMSKGPFNITFLAKSIFIRSNAPHGDTTINSYSDLGGFNR